MFWFALIVFSIATFLFLRRSIIADKQQQFVLHELNKAVDHKDASLYPGNSRRPNG